MVLIILHPLLMVKKDPYRFLATSLRSMHERRLSVAISQLLLLCHCPSPYHVASLCSSHESSDPILVCRVEEFHNIPVPHVCSEHQCHIAFGTFLAFLERCFLTALVSPAAAARMRGVQEGSRAAGF